MRTRSGGNATGARAMRRTAVCALVAVGALSACAPSGGRGAVAGAATTHREEVAVLHQLVQCIRAHGVPDFPDGSIDSHGVVSFPASAPRVPDAAVAACQSIFDRLPPQPTSSPPVPQSLFQKLLSFARCMRSHGVTDWPDPTPDGYFHLDARLIAAGKRGTYQQMQVCEQANPGVAGHFSISQGG